MRTILRRPAVAFALGAVLVLAAAGGRAAVAALGEDTVHACYKPSNGNLYLIGGESRRTACQPGDLPIEWSVQGPAGPPGEQGENGDKGDPGEDGTPFDGTFESPNGLYSLSVTDAGIELRSQFGALVRMNGATISIDTAGPVRIEGLPVTVDSQLVQLGACGGGQGVARLGDTVLAPPPNGTGAITSSSVQVRAC